MTGGDGDPASISALGAALHRTADRLVDDVHALEAPARRPGDGHQDPTVLEKELLTRAATELDAVAALLQGLTAASAELSARVRALEPDLRRADLVVEGALVLEAPGPSRAEPETRLRERERLQELLNRVTAGRARETALLRRELERSTAALAALSVRARSRR